MLFDVVPIIDAGDSKLSASRGGGSNLTKPVRQGHKALSAWAVLLIGVVLVVLVALPTYHFHNRNFRQDEIYTVHAGTTLSISETAQWMAVNGVHPAGWRIVAATWVKLTGIEPPVARYFSTLCTLLSFALLFRLAADLFDYSIGLYAVFFLGTLNFTQFYMHELRPYAMLVLTSIGIQFAFLRWLRRPGLKYAMLFVMFGVAGLQTHYFAGYIIAGEFVVLLLLVRWDRALYLRAVGLFVAIGLSLIAWALPLLNRWINGADKSYAEPSNADTLQLLYHTLQIRPEAVGLVLLLTALLIPVGATFWRPGTPGAQPVERFRYAPEWRKLVLIIVPAVALAAAFTVNLAFETVTARNLIVILPPLTIVAAFGLRKLPWQTQLIALVIVAIPAVRDFHPLVPNAPNREAWQFMQQDIKPGDRVVLHIRKAGVSQSLAFYLLDQPDFPLGRDAIYHIAGHGINFPGDPLVYRVSNNDPATLRGFEDFLGSAEQVWYFANDPNETLVQPFLDTIQRDYALFRTDTLADSTDPRVKFAATEYRLLPGNVGALYLFGHAVELDGWTVRDGVDVRICEPVVVETVWRAPNPPQVSYGIGLVLADSNGMGVTAVDAPPSSLLTVNWKTGVYYLDRRVLTVPCDLSAGDYSLLVGLHDQATAEPLPAAHMDGTLNDSSMVYLTTLHVAR